MGIGGVTGLAYDGTTLFAMPDACSSGDLWELDPATALGLPLGPTCAFQNPDIT